MVLAKYHLLGNFEGFPSELSDFFLSLSQLHQCQKQDRNLCCSVVLLFPRSYIALRSIRPVKFFITFRVLFNMFIRQILQ